MRILAELFLCTLLLFGLDSFAGGISLDPGTRYEFTDCASGGSASQTAIEGDYLLRVTDADSWLCYAATCATLGEKFPAGTVMRISVPRAGQAFSCRSGASTGDVILTRVQ